MGIDKLGMPLAAFVSVIACIAGATIRALATHWPHKHLVCLILLISGEVIFQCAFFVLYALRAYIGIRYFSERLRPMVIGISYSVSTSSLTFAYILIPQFEAKYGIRATFWLATAAVAVDFLCSLLLILLAHFNGQMKAMELKFRIIAAQLRTQSSFDIKAPLRALKSFQTEYWIFLVPLATFRGACGAYSSNTVKIQNSLFPSVSPTQASINHGIGVIVQVVCSPLSGFLAGLTSLHLHICLFCAIVNILGFVIFLIPSGSPLAADLIVGGTYVSIVSTLKGFVGNYVPAVYLGFATALVIAFSQLLYGVLTLLTGMIQDRLTQAVGTRVALSVYMSCLGIATCCIIVLMVKTRKNLEEEDRNKGEKNEKNDDYMNDSVTDVTSVSNANVSTTRL